MKNIDYEKVAQYCKTNWREMSEKVINIADDVCKNKFLFDMPWDMERTCEPTVFEGEIDWNLIKNGDNEYLFQMNRHRYFINLAQSYRLTGNEKYVKCFMRLMRDWIERVPCPFNSGNHPWRSLETGLRGEYWTKAMAIVKDCPLIDDVFTELYRKSLDEHGKMLVKCHDAHKKLSNWGVIQDHGLFAIGIELQNQEYIDIALERLFKQANIQITADGVHWEVSSMYHNEVLNCFLDVIIRARDNGIELPEAFLGNIKKMAQANLAWIKPNRKQPLFGDSDYTDIRDILSVCALIFNDSSMKALAFEKLDYESAWLFGMQGVQDYEKIIARLPEFTSVSLRDSGSYIMRSGWRRNANYLIFHNGYTGGGHAHEDKLSFELTVGGEDILTDCGRYTYKWGRQRKYLKSYRAHNTVAVDGRQFVKSYGWGYLRLAPAVKQEMVIQNDYNFVSGAHLGYFRSPFGSVLVSRSILWIKPDIYIILDEFAANGFHRYEQYFNFAPGGNLSLGTNDAVYTVGGVQALTSFLTDGIKVKKFEGMYSDHYNQIESIESVKTSFSAFGNTHAVTVIVGNKGGEYDSISVKSIPVLLNGKPLSSKKAQGIEIQLGDEKYTVILAFNELMRVVTCGGKDAAGKITYYKNDEHHVVLW